jgi:low affinity Fe/Cu permease
MVFLIQNSQNRDDKAVQIKLDELIRAIDPARNQLINVESSSEEELQKLKKDFSGLGNNFKQ